MGKTFMSYEPDFFHYSKEASTSMHSAHFHSTYELYYLINGKRRYFIKDRFYEIKPGDLILIPPETVHRVQNSVEHVKGEYYERYLLCFTKKLLDPSFEKCFSVYHYRPDREDSMLIKSIIEKMGEEVKNRDEYYMQMYSTYLSQIMVILARKYLRTESSEEKPYSKIDSVIEEISKYIYANQSDMNLSLSGIAASFGYSKEYLSKSFKEATGFGYSEFLIKTRLASSIELLTSTTLSIKEIAVNCGFKDSNYFDAVFKKKIGVTPSEYRLRITDASERG